MVPLRGSPVYPPVHSPTAPGQQSYPGLSNWPLSRASFIPSPRWQGPSSYAQLILPQGVVPVAGWNAYPVSHSLSSVFFFLLKVDVLSIYWLKTSLWSFSICSHCLSFWHWILWIVILAINISLFFSFSLLMILFIIIILVKNAWSAVHLLLTLKKTW